MAHSKPAPTFRLPDGRELAIGSDSSDYTTVVLVVTPSDHGRSEIHECLPPGVVRRSLWDSLTPDQRSALVEWCWAQGIEVVSVYRDALWAWQLEQHQQAVLASEREITIAHDMEQLTRAADERRAWVRGDAP